MDEVRFMNKTYSTELIKIPKWKYWFSYKDHTYCIETVFHTVEDHDEKLCSYNRITLMEYGPNEDLWESYTFTFDEYIDYSEQKEFTPHNCLTFNDRIFNNICKNFIKKDFEVYPEKYYSSKSHI